MAVPSKQATERLECSTIWGGNRSTDTAVCTNAVTASLYSSSCDGGKGGDIYYFSVCAGDCLTRAAVADVVGHGTSVSEVSTWLYKAIAARMDMADSAGILRELNEVAVSRGLDALTTAVIFETYAGEDTAFFAYAGHPPLLKRGPEGAWGPMTNSANEAGHNLPLGVLADTVYDQGHGTLAPGDWLFAYTDGIIEAQRPDGEMFGLGRLQDVLNAHQHDDAESLKRAVLDALRTHTGGPLEHDDVTIMVLAAH